MPGNRNVCAVIKVYGQGNVDVFAMMVLGLLIRRKFREEIAEITILFLMEWF